MPVPFLVGASWSGGLYGRSGGSPLHIRRSSNTRRLVLLGVYVLRDRSAMRVSDTLRVTTKEVQSSLDVNIRRIEVRSPLVGVKRVCGLIVT